MNIRRAIFLPFVLLFSHFHGLAQDQPFSIVIHGGAGTITREAMTDEREQQYKQALSEALTIGYDLLAEGKSSTEVVIATIEYMENSPLFNSGKGAVYTAKGEHELDASIMEGSDLNAGAVAGVKVIKNPIKAAYEVMVNSDHVMLSGEGAEQFAKSQGLETVSNDYFDTPSRLKSYERVKSRREGKGAIKREGAEKYGTVGCVALDQDGNITAGTSTGGMTYKQYGRIGDSPVIGAGTYADNEAAGISATGHGEYFIRNAVAYDIVARIRYLNESVEQAAEKVIFGRMAEMGGTGGVIVLSPEGEVAMIFNTEGMYRGYRKSGENEVIEIYKD